MCWEASMSKTKDPPLLEFLFLAPVILNRMVRVSFVEMVRSEQREEEGEGKESCRDLQAKGTAGERLSAPLGHL